jgi:transforming growth factor-beta-induced protein
MKKIKLFALAILASMSSESFAQTNLFDDVIAVSPNHNYLEAALLQEGLASALQDPSATLTVFAPDDQAFESLALALGTDINGLLALDNLSDILLYHVLGVPVLSNQVTNGAVVQPLGGGNTLKLTATASGIVFINHAQVTVADITMDNGVLHVVDNVLLPYETVVDVALDNGFTYLATAVITAELLPALTNPLATYTVFAPTNEAFEALAGALGTDVNGLLALPNLADVLTYHVLATAVPSSAVTNGAIVQPISNTNTLKLTVTGTGLVFVNQAQVTLADVTADNGVVHVINGVVLPVQTVVDLAINNGLSTLATAVVQEELVPTLSDPLALFTVFAPNNEAFDNLATALGTDINGILALPNLTEVLTYHVVAGEILSTELVAGPLNTLNGETVTISITNGAMVNASNVILADVQGDNGVAHVIDAVLLPNATSVANATAAGISVFPNPVVNALNIVYPSSARFSVTDMSGKLIESGTVMGRAQLDMSSFADGMYILKVSGNEGQFVSTIVKN